MNTFDSNHHICKSIEDLCCFYPLRVQQLFTNLDLKQPKLETVAKLVKRRDWISACKALNEYYRQSDRFDWIAKLEFDRSEIATVNTEQILQDIYTFQSATGTVPRFENGSLDWNYQGPKSDPEWGWHLNRHYHLLALLQAYQQTKNLLYVDYISVQIVDWVIYNPSQQNFTTKMSWRGLEVAFRVFHWTQIFYILQQVDRFTEVARVLLLSSILDHARYLKYFSSWGVNWLVKEMNALAMIAVCWSEFRNSDDWLKYAKTNILKELNQQIYPDGVQKELSSHYHRVALQDFQSFANLMAICGKEVPLELKRSLEQMWNYLAYTLRPSGYGVLNNDSDLDDNRHLVARASEIYQRDDWKYIISNGKAGSKPKNEPSSPFIWSGQFILRNSWSEKAHWAFFDSGPAGVYYHSHNDKLHLSVSAYGRDLLVDSGRYSYVRDKFWHYFRGSASHNLVLVDGNGQKNDFSESFRPISDSYKITPQFDYIYGIFDRGFVNVKDKVVHFRTVVYLRNKYWIVIDRLVCNRSHEIQALWHFHPDCKVAVEAESVVSIDRHVGNLRIIPVSNLLWKINIVRGQNDPVQGWWSPKYNIKVPNSTAVYSTQISESSIFAWIILPAPDLVPYPKIGSISISSESVAMFVEQEKIVVGLSNKKYVNISNYQ